MSAGEQQPLTCTGRNQASRSPCLTPLPAKAQHPHGNTCTAATQSSNPQATATSNTRQRFVHTPPTHDLAAAAAAAPPTHHFGSALGLPCGRLPRRLVLLPVGIIVEISAGERGLHTREAHSVAFLESGHHQFKAGVASFSA